MYFTVGYGHVSRRWTCTLVPSPFYYSDNEDVTEVNEGSGLGCDKVCGSELFTIISKAKFSALKKRKRLATNKGCSSFSRPLLLIFRSLDKETTVQKSGSELLTLKTYSVYLLLPQKSYNRNVPLIEKAYFYPIKKCMLKINVQGNCC